MATVDVTKTLDEGSLKGYQVLLIIGTALTIILDGIDNQLLPNAIPTLMGEWGQERPYFLNALALGPFGMLIGGLIGGVLGDRLGRKVALLASVLTFAVLTLAISTVTSIGMLELLRFLAGVGLGGAMPNAATLAAEYVPRRQRPFAVTLTIICIPLGGFVAAYVASLILPDWRLLFRIGGLIPLVLALLLWRILPESPRYLVGQRRRWPELTAIIRKMGHTVPDGAEYVNPAAAGAPARSSNGIYFILVIAAVLALWQYSYLQGSGALQVGASVVVVLSLWAAVRGFPRAYRMDTLALFGSFFFCLTVNYVIIQLLVTMLTGEAGLARPIANRALAISNIGGVMGALAGAFVIQRLGSRIAMLGMSALAIVCALVLMNMRPDPANAIELLQPATWGVFGLLILVLGALLNGVQTTMYGLATNVYPAEIRGTGVGTAVAVGRIGNVLAVFVGNYALMNGVVVGSMVISPEGIPGYFTSIAVLMGLVFLSLALVRRHITVHAPAPAASTH